MAVFVEEFFAVLFVSITVEQSLLLFTRNFYHFSMQDRSHTPPRHSHALTHYGRRPCLKCATTRGVIATVIATRMGAISYPSSSHDNPSPKQQTYLVYRIRDDKRARRRVEPGS